MQKNGHHYLALPWQQSLSSCNGSHILSQDILCALWKKQKTALPHEAIEGFGEGSK